MGLPLKEMMRTQVSVIFVLDSYEGFLLYFTVTRNIFHFDQLFFYMCIGAININVCAFGNEIFC